MASKNAPAVPRRLYADFCNKIGAKRTFASTQHFVTDKELAKSYPVLHWANENALFDTLAGIELSLSI
jgi:hypothetical protein